MHKIINFIKKRDNLLAVAIIIIATVGVSLNFVITISDELWNFQNIYKIYNGFKIYEDANIIITPIFFYIANILFKIIGANFLTFNIYSILINIILYLSIYILCKKMEFSKKTSLIIMLISILIEAYFFKISVANYNMLALALYLIGLILAIKSKNRRRDYIIQGTIAFLVLMTKQNMGVYYILSIIFTELIKSENIKNKIKNISVELVTIAILGIIFILYYASQGILYGFINYTILGMFEFGQKNISINWLAIVVCIALIGINLYASYTFIKSDKIQEKQKEILKKLNIFAFFLVFAIFPIINLAHLSIGISLEILTTIYIGKIIINNIINKKMNLLKNIIIITTLIILVYNSGTLLINWINIINSEDYQFKYEDPYYGAILSEENYTNIQKMKEYIENNDKDVIILSAEAAMYMIPLNKNNGKMDLPFKGNLGKEGEKGLINDIENLKNTEILIIKDERDMIWQESQEVRKYIINNLNYEGEINNFLIYSTVT